MLYDLKPVQDGGPASLDGVSWWLRAGPVAWIIYAVSMAVLGRPPLVTGAAVDRVDAGEGDDPSTLHDNGLALDLRANDVDAETRERYARALAAALAPFVGVRVIGPYPLPRGHVHVEIHPGTMVKAGFAAAVGAMLVLWIAPRV
jgi:hypothetical protein